MVLRVLVARAELFQTRAVTRWEDGEEDRHPGRRSLTLNSHHEFGPPHDRRRSRTLADGNGR